jgi:hypothetical protein
MDMRFKQLPETMLNGLQNIRFHHRESMKSLPPCMGGRLSLWIRSGGQKIQASILQYPASMNPEEILHRRVRIRGVCQTIMHDKGKVETTRLLSNSFYDDVDLMGDSN